MQYVLTTPKVIGDMDHQTSVAAFQIASVSLNFEPTYANAGVAVLSICLIEPTTGYKRTIVYKDASALTFWQGVASNMSTKIFNKLIADNKLPPGTLQ